MKGRERLKSTVEVLRPKEAPQRTLASVAYFFANPLLFLLLLSSYLYFHPPVRVLNTTSIDLLTPQEIVTLLPYAIKYQTIEWLKGEGQLRSSESSDSLLSTISQQSRDALGRDFPLQWLRELNATILNPDSIWSRVPGFFSFTNFVWLVSIILLVIASHKILLNLTLALYRLCSNIPTMVYETFFYLLCFGFIVAGVGFGVDIGAYIALTGLTGLIPCFVFTGKLHTSKGDGEVFMAMMFGFLTLTWSITAVAFESQVIGLGSVMYLTAALFLTETLSPLCALINFPSSWKVLRAVVNVLFVLLGSLFFVVVFPSTIVGRIFAPGGLFFGALGYFMGTLCVSSTFYSNDTDFTTQILMVGSGFGGVSAGLIWGLSQLTSISGTFLILWVLIKHVEYPWGNKRWSYGLFTFAALLYVISLVIRSYPQFFILILLH